MIVQASCSKKNFRQVVYHRNFCGRYKEPKLLYNGRTRSYSLAASNQRYSRQAGLLGYYSRPPFSMIEADEFLTKLNCLHPSLKFTFEKKKEKCLLFLDVCVERTDIGFEISVYQKPTFISQYLRWECFGALKRKTSLISTLVGLHLALMICTKRRLNGEVERMKNISLNNGYSKYVINAHAAQWQASDSSLSKNEGTPCGDLSFLS